MRLHLKIVTFQGPLEIASQLSEALRMDVVVVDHATPLPARDTILVGPLAFERFANADCKILLHEAGHAVENPFSIESGMLIWRYCPSDETSMASLVRWVKHHLYGTPLLVSVIIPAYNRQDHLRFCLEALFKQNLSPDSYEVIVVDDGSSDATAAVAERFPTKTIRTSNRGPGAARNVGIEAAKGDILIFLDADILVENDYLDQICQRFRLSNSLLLLGARRHLPPGHTNAESGGYNLDSREKLLRRYSFCLSHLNCPWSLAYTCNFSITKHFLGSIRFDESFVGWGLEDIDFAYRLHQQGAHFIFSKIICGYHLYHDRQLTMNRYLSWLQNLELFLKKHPGDKAQGFSLFKQVFHPEIKANYFDVFDQFENSLSCRQHIDVYDFANAEGDPIDWIKQKCQEATKDFVLLSSSSNAALDVYVPFFKHPRMKSYLPNEDWKQALCQN